MTCLRSLAIVLVLVGCGHTSSPPERSSPLLVRSGSLAADAALIDTRDADPLWATDTAGSTRFEDRTGIVAGAIPGHEADMPRGLRGLPGNEIWTCLEAGVAHFAAGAWTFTAWTAFGTPDAPAYCDALDARSSNDVWLTGSSSLCHFDGTGWACRSDLPGQVREIALTATHVWMAHDTGAGAETELLVIDTSTTNGTITSVSVGALVAIGTITPVPGTEQVYLTHDPHAFMNGDTSVRLFSTSGLVRTETAQDVIPISATETYLIQFFDDTTEHCSGFIIGTCTGVELWSQVVVTHVVGATSTEVAHFTDPAGGAVPTEAIRVDDTIEFIGNPAFALP